MTVTINGSGTISGVSSLPTPLINQSLTTPIISTTMGVGGATPSASGSGITFPATQNASSDANTLDDYEEGTFTLTWWSAAGGTGTNLGQSTTNNRYVKIGKAVTIIFDRAGIGSGTCASFTGLPFIPIAPASTISSDSCVMYWDSTYPTAMSYRTADGIYSRGTLTYQTA